MKKIIILTFYFGKSPWYLDYFIQSCVDNKDVDFIFFTDIQGIKFIGNNIQIITIGFEEFSRTISNYFSFELNIRHPIKLCDIRPSFGEVFQDLIQDYDFWGYCDVDVIFGRIRYFLDDSVLETNDVIFTKPDYPSGFFAIYKNEKYINALYRSSQDYIKVFQDEKLLLFDECGGNYSQVCSGVNILDTKYVIDSMHHILERNKDSINVLYEFYSIEGTPGKIKYDNGVLTYKNEFEVLLYHLTAIKNNIFFKNNSLKKRELNSYLIGEFSFYKNNGISIFYYTIYEKFAPLFKRIVLKMDYLISDRLNYRNTKILKEGEYKYMDLSLFVYFENDNLHLNFKGEIGFKIVFLTIFKNIFFIPELKQYFIVQNFNTNHCISLILPDGNLKNYTL
ncbi:DUF6625 family protein [Flavobacterium taihuense]|uniref:Uncharacterized protein n=1 Tax=Flavobacterium taihuense TaxID=2857508 RepID=A0ABS6XRM7_9FLAO|nr:DUF6625 family protein [Flavobacterium taihuense]MBW4359323.1 hypothetical protein [Flavobacterium taihuense]